MKNAAPVTPAKAGVHDHRAVFMGPGFRRDDGKEGLARQARQSFSLDSAARSAGP
jgi:hypothetical protein